MSTTAYTSSAHLKTRRQSQIPLLGLSMPIGGESTSTTSRRLIRNRWVKLLVGSVAVLWVLSYIASRDKGSTISLWSESMFGKVNGCEAKGEFSRWRSEDEQRRLTIRIQPQADGKATENPDNTILTQPFHPILSSQLPSFFDNSSDYLPPASLSLHDQTCTTPATHSLPLLPKSRVTSSSPTIFFSVCTAPERALTYAPVWKHFMSAPEFVKGEEEASLPAPGCVVTDAQGTGDSKGMSKANAEFRRQGLSCTMKESSRVGQRYEMRVLGLIRDAWVESERRRWQEGARLVEWFVFGDDDTWWSDAGMLREMLAAFDSREDHFFGSFSESRGTIEHFGRISFGGGGTIISRGLVRKMQTTIDRCAEMFSDVFGGDGLISHCAAFTRAENLENIVEEIPSMRQMDLRGDATGYLTSGRTPFMSLHHWASWLSLVPDRPGLSTIELFSRAASILGGPNFLRRFLFDSGSVEITLGYAVTLYRYALKEEDLGAAEHTWEAHDPYLPVRRKLEEGTEKLTYYISSIERISPNLAIFHHTCSHPSVSSSSLKTFSILYDTRTAETTWSSRFFGKDRAAQASPRSNLSDKQRQRTRRITFHS